MYVHVILYQEQVTSCNKTISQPILESAHSNEFMDITTPPPILFYKTVTMYTFEHFVYFLKNSSNESIHLSRQVLSC